MFLIIYITVNIETVIL